MTTAEAKYTGRCSQFCWTLIHLCIYLILLLRSGTVLHKWFFEGEAASSEIIWLHILYVVNYVVYFWLCYSDPGFLKSDIEQGSYINSQLNRKRSEFADCLLSDNNNSVTLRFCDYCQLYQPLRSKHCKSCERCIARYDHHCFFIGNCVGENNHLLFMVYLALESVLVFWTMIVSFDGYQKAPNLDSWLINNGMVLFVTVVSGFSVFLPSGLFFYHFFLMLTNQTSWEFSKRNKITYLREVPETYFPFDAGIIKNICWFCVSRTLQRSYTRWEILLPPVEVMKENSRRQFNIWNNQYYSCFEC